MYIKGSRVSQRRKEMGFSQEKLAELLNVSQNQVSKYERGESEASTETLVSLARVLDTTTDWLLGLTDDRFKPIPRSDSLSEWQREILNIMQSHDEDYQKRVVEIAKLVN